ncbi:hypothetical protein LUZ60_007840 [Juncus effusus]|nr:hypothetical protein LUZ60_007840 [Juncus effusus]
MDAVLCDELIEEILQRVPSSSSPSISLVSKRWLFLLRSSTTSLSLRIPVTDLTTTTSSLSALLSHYPFLSTLTILSSNQEETTINLSNNHNNLSPSSSDALLRTIASSPCSSHLSDLRFLPGSPVSPSALHLASSSLSQLTSLHITSVLPLNLQWLIHFPFLKSFSLVNTSPKPSNPNPEPTNPNPEPSQLQTLPIETLSLSGIRSTDRGLAWLWTRSTNLRYLQLHSCESTGDGPSSAAFSHCLTSLLSLELRTCRAIADRVLLLAADKCRNLASLLLYDGGGRDALHLFINRRGPSLRTLDLRLPLDLHNDHLLAMAGTGDLQSGLASLKLQSCCLVTGDGLRSLARSPVGSAIEELALVNCDVVEKEPGLLTFMAQNMRRLKRVDLSHNESLTDKEISAMLASCKDLVEIRLKGCGAISGAVINALVKNCEMLEMVDLRRCEGINGEDLERFMREGKRIKEVIVEGFKVKESVQELGEKKGVKIFG